MTGRRFPGSARPRAREPAFRQALDELDRVPVGILHVESPVPDCSKGGQARERDAAGCEVRPHRLRILDLQTELDEAIGLRGTLGPQLDPLHVVDPHEGTADAAVVIRQAELVRVSEDVAIICECLLDVARLERHVGKADDSRAPRVLLRVTHSFFNSSSCIPALGIPFPWRHRCPAAPARARRAAPFRPRTRRRGPPCPSSASPDQGD